MRNTKWVMVMFLVALLCFAPLSYTQASEDKTTAQDVKQAMQDLLSKLKEYTFDHRNDAVKQTEQALEKLDTRIDALETRIYNSWTKMEKSSQDEAQAGLKDLRKQRIALAEWYGSLKNSSENTWDKMKNGFSNTYQSVVDAWDKVEKKY